MCVVRWFVILEDSTLKECHGKFFIFNEDLFMLTRYVLLLCVVYYVLLC